MAIRLTIQDKRSTAAPLERVFRGDDILIGRAPLCDVCLPDMHVSTRHARIYLQDHRYVIEDLGSVNGTLVDGKKLVPHRPRPLSTSARIALTNYDIAFETGVFPAAADDDSVSLTHAKALLRATMDTRTSHAPALLVTGGPSKAVRLPLTPDVFPIRIGRSRSSDLFLDDPEVSRSHALLSTDEEGALWLEDLGSRSGTRVNGTPIADRVRVAFGDTIALGKTTLMIEHPVDVLLHAIQDAPEEQTATFARAGLSPSVRVELPPSPATQEPPSEGGDKDDDGDGAALPIGSADPLDAPGNYEYQQTAELPTVHETGRRSDWGLIVVGVITVGLSIAGIAWLLH